MAGDPAQQDEMVSQFCGMTGVAPSEARQYLDTNHWDVESAVTEYYAEQDEAEHNMRSAGGNDPYSDDEEANITPPAGRTLGGGGAPSGPVPASSMPTSSSSRKKAPQKKFATLGDLNSGGGGGGDAGDDSDEDPNQDFFAGGEKSGLAVQNPDDIKKRILEKAKQPLPQSGGTAPPAAARSNFSGAARTLGGDDTPSEKIEDPNQQRPQPATRVQRILHFWNDGFSVGEGDLYRSDDPRNAEILDGIRQGRAPLSIMDVKPGQEVDVDIKQHQENYVRPKPKYKPFGGSGQRLGSPTPGSDSAATASPTPNPPAAASTTTSGPPQNPHIDESQPTVTLQIRLGDGTRLSSRFNTTQTIGDVYSFVTAASPDSVAREWVLMTTFPSKELTDKSAVLGDLAEFKRGGVVVQKWK